MAGGKLYLNCEHAGVREDYDPHSEDSKEGSDVNLCPHNSPVRSLDFQVGESCIVPKIQVCVRKRPLSIKELSESDPDVIEMSQPGHVTVNEPHYLVDLSEFVESHTFRVDHTFDEKVSTMEDIFELLRSDNECAKYSITVAFFEIYCSRVYDLLNRRSVVRVLEDSNGAVRLLGLSEISVETSEETLTLLRRSCRLRTSGQTALNLTSSRSHAIFQINLRSGTSLIGRFSLVDLAGNERGSDLPITGTGTNSDIAKTRRIESGEINKSLLALKECIRAMCRLPRRSHHSHSSNYHHQLGGGGTGAARLPFRNSKLTQVLRESFLGRRARTCMIAMVAPGLSCAEHSLNTLRYAQLVKRMPPFECWPKVAAHAMQATRPPTFLSPPAHLAVNANTNGTGCGNFGGSRRSCSRESFKSVCSCCSCSTEDSHEVSVQHFAPQSCVSQALSDLVLQHRQLLERTKIMLCCVLYLLRWSGSLVAFFRNCHRGCPVTISFWSAPERIQKVDCSTNNFHITNALTLFNSRLHSSFQPIQKGFSNWQAHISGISQIYDVGSHPGERGLQTLEY
ncbi:unnamed protein product [Hydatigera taeniaeformis]|uniref:Kinesin-like protein n=1 Tax=Hydatigena taeniaeformis TaxID=6205 RepID=A0A0R3X2F1_HYDTA|nr:unnamed protein product [Hydatigera taeniaeformis]